MFDLLIQDALVFDGQGTPPRHADVCIDQGHIVEIDASRSVRARARETVHAQGAALMPGIVDLHTHYDAQVTWDRTMSPSPALGVTTAVIGNCGFGIAPCPPDLRETMLKNLSVVEGMNLDALLTGVDWKFETFGQYLDQLRNIGPYLNTAVFAGHSVVRTAVMGERASTQIDPDPEDLRQMCVLVREAMGAGAIGFASSFSPNHSGYGGRPMPSTIAPESELRALTQAMSEQGRGVFMMATGSRASPEVMESIAAQTGRPAYISTVLTMYNEANPDLALQYYEQCAAAQARGHELCVLTSCQPLSFDFTLTDPYVLLSHPAFERIKSARVDELPAIYGDPEFRAAFRANLRQPRTGILFLGNWQHVEVGVAAQPEHRALEGITIAQLASSRGVDPVDAFFDLALAEDLATHFIGKFFNNSDSGVAPLLRHPAGIITLSDAGAHLGYMCDAGFGLHLLGHWVRDRQLFPLEEGIRRLTSQAADAFRIPARGRIVEGAPADLLLFDPDTVGISKPVVRPDLPGGASRMIRESRGVQGVWVNGIRVHDGQQYCELDRGPGHVLDQFNQ